MFPLPFQRGYPSSLPLPSPGAWLPGTTARCPFAFHWWEVRRKGEAGGVPGERHWWLFLALLGGGLMGGSQCGPSEAAASTLCSLCGRGRHGCPTPGFASLSPVTSALFMSVPFLG